MAFLRRRPTGVQQPTEVKKEVKSFGNAFNEDKPKLDPATKLAEQLRTEAEARKALGIKPAGVRILGMSGRIEG